MQMAVIEAARNLLNIKNASTSEFGNNCTPVIGLLEEWQKGKIRIKGSEKNLGGTMRLGLYEAVLKNNSLISKIYSEKKIKERHRHRYEVNIEYKDDFEKKGLIFSALSPDGMLPEIIELKDHPWFVGVQFHPEFRSRPFTPHPLFTSFVEAAKKQWSIFYFQKLSATRTQVTLVGLGYTNDDQSKQLRDFFIAGNKLSIAKLKASLEKNN